MTKIIEYIMNIEALSIANFIGKTFLAFVVLAMGVAVVERLTLPDTSLSRLWRSLHPSTGLILVDEPQVYTRERLVNDRLREATWLETLLRDSQALATAGRFGRPDIISSRGTRLQATFGSAKPQSPNAQAEANTATGRSADDLSPVRLAPNGDSDPTPLDAYLDEERYRTLIRSALMATQLDDQHDTQGNTLYRMSFGVSLVPSRYSRAVAIVTAQLSEKTDESLPDYQELMEEWRIDLQKLLIQKQADRLASLNGGRPLESEGIEFQEFLATEICKLVTSGLRFEENSDSKCQERELTYQIIENYYKKFNQYDGLDGMIYYIYQSVQQNESVFRSTKCNEILSLNSIVDTIICNSDVFSPEKISSIIFEKCYNHFIPSRTVFCPDRSNYSEIRSMMALYSILKIVNDSEKNNRFKRNTHATSDLPNKVNSVNTAYQSINRPLGKVDYAKAVENIAICDVNYFRANQIISDLANAPIYIDLSRETYCLNAEFSSDPKIRDKLLSLNRAMSDSKILWEYTIHSFSKLKSKYQSNAVQIDKFFKAEIPPYCSDQCQPKISFQNTDESSSKEEEEKEKNRLAKELYTELEKPIVFTYALEPGTEVQRISGALRSYEQIGIGGKPWADSEADVGAKIERITELAALERETLILGFGNWIGKHVAKNEDEKNASKDKIIENNEKIHNLGSTRFGWFILPRMMVGSKEGGQQATDRKLLSVLLSVPSWWRQAKVDITTCWVKIDDLATRKKSDEICKAGDEGFDERPHFVRLPGRPDELQQKLTFEVIKFPYISSETPPVELEAGRPALIPIVGGRLWRSPLVMLGRQKADRIEVLPNMEGILAEFTCLEPQSGIGGGDVMLRVWTSEGQTPGQGYFINPFKARKDVPNDLPCKNDSTQSQKAPPASPVPRDPTSPSPPNEESAQAKPPGEGG